MAITKLTLEEYEAKFDVVIASFDERIEKMSGNSNASSGVSNLKALRKMVIDLKKKAKRVKKSKKKANPNRKVKSYGITKELQEFLKVDEGIKLTRNDIICALCVYVKIKPEEVRETHTRWSYLNTEGRNLQNPENKNQILVDEKLKKLFKIDDNNIIYLTFQKLITQHLINIDEE